MSTPAISRREERLPLGDFSPQPFHTASVVFHSRGEARLAIRRMKNDDQRIREKEEDGQLANRCTTSDWRRIV